MYMRERGVCYLCGEEAEIKTVVQIDGIRCGNCKLHYRVDMAKKLYFDNPGALGPGDKEKIRDHLIEIGCGDDNSDDPILITCDMINEIKRYSIRK
jgi:hypothetical protein